MNFEFKKSFAKDLKKRKHQKKLLNNVQEIIEEVEAADNLNEIKNFKKLQIGDKYYRIKLGEYRIGLIFEEGTVYFIRFLHRSEIYRFFP